MALTQITTNIIADDAITADKIAAGALDSTHVTGITTSDITEGTNLYYTDARVGSYLTTNTYATESYVTTAVANLVDAAPTTLDTLNELAAALGDDANFSTTVTNNLALKYDAADFNTDWDTRLGTKTTTDLTEGTNLYYTDARFDTRLGTKTTTDLTEGTNLYYTSTRFDTAFSAKTTTDLTEGTNLYYTDARVDSRLSSGSVATITTSSDVTVGNDLSVTGTVTVGGSPLGTAATSDTTDFDPAGEAVALAIALG